MAVPEGYTEVGLIGLVNKGNYDPLTEYSKYNFVYYQGSTYLYINELPQSGVTPSDDGVTWQYMSRGMIMDNTPTQGSQNAVTSGGIYDSERALKTEIQNEQTAATTKATDTNNVLGQGTVTNATNVQALLDNVTDKDTNPTKDSAKTVTSGGVYSADKATREMIAPVEENATSSAPYAIGEQLIFNGVLCEATSAISIGDTLAMGTNLSTANKITNRDSTPTANSTKLVTSGGVYSADNQIRENIANVEGATSSHPYTVGKQLIFNGLLCKATSAISVGDTLAVGTNLALADNVVEQIYSLNQGLANSLDNISHENLLDNPWFTVNQRSFASTSSALGYTVDRWRVAYNPALNTCELTSNGMVLNSVSKILILQQRFDEEQFKSVVGKMATFSVLLSDGTMYKGSAIFPQKGDASDAVPINNADLDVYYQYNSNSDNLPSVGIYPKVGKTVTIKAVKLELGSVSTLAMDTAPNYQQELAKCQRYFQRIKSNQNGMQILQTIANSSTTSRGLIILSECMRKTPTVTVSDITAFSLFNSGSSKQLSSIALLTIDDNKKYCKLTISSTSATTMTANEVYALELANGAYIDFSAEL